MNKLKLCGLGIMLLGGSPWAEAEKEHSFSKHLLNFNDQEQAYMDYDSAVACLEKDELDNAEVIFLDILKKLPSHSLSRIQLATVYLKRGQIEEAEVLLNAGQQWKGSEPEILKLLAVCALRNARPEQALAYLSKVKTPQKTTDYQGLLAFSLHESGKYKEAQETYVNLVQAEPQQARWWLGLSLALDAQQQFPLAKAGYQKVKSLGNLEAAALEYVDQRLASISLKAR